MSARPKNLNHRRVSDCSFYIPHFGFCQQRRALGSFMCAGHARAKCKGCGKPATKACGRMAQMMCGTPICDKCTCPMRH